MSKMRAIEAAVLVMRREGVDTAFGIPGAAINPLYSALQKVGGIDHVLARHVEGASHMAEGYTRTKAGNIGVCIGTSGPAGTDMVTGLYSASADSIPILCITGQAPRARLHKEDFQAVDITSIVKPVTKWATTVLEPGQVPYAFQKAFYEMRSGRPGPVLVDIPKDITVAQCKYTPPKGEISMRSYAPVNKGHQGQIKKAVQMLLAAERPMIYTGGGVILSNAAPELNKLVSQLGAPCTSTLMGLGGYPASSGQFVGMPGMHGTYEANMAMQHCDVLLAIGARFDDRVIGNPKHFAQNARKIIHIDIDPSSISKRVRVDVPIVGNVKDVLADLSAQYEVAAAEHKPASITKWWEQVETWRGKECLKFANSDEVIKPQYVVEKLWEVTGGDAFVTSDVGQHQMWAAQYYKFDKPRRWINSGGLGTMGVGLPYAMGVQMANPGHDIAVITGEASIQMNIQELSTCAQYRLTPKIVCLNNRFLGMVRQWQQIDYGSRYSESYMDSLPDFVKVAEAYGHVGLRIERPADVEPALREAFKKHKDRLVFLDFITDRTENVWPMVKAGRGLTEMLLGSEDL